MPVAGAFLAAVHGKLLHFAAVNDISLH
jgi:hypothetical protein